VSLKSVRLQQIRKSFGSNRVIDELELDIEPGEFFVLLGPSGCGKSTLLNIVAGLEEAGSGRVFIGERDVTSWEPGQRDVAMVFQSYALYPAMSVRRNIGFALTINGMPKLEVASRVQEVARLLHIEELLDRKPKQLSGGQQQRVAIGRALVRDPAVLLLDEPLSNLDARLRADLRIELKQLHRKSPRTTLYVTHDQIEAMTLGTRAAVLDKGRIQQCAPPDVIYNRPANKFVASFVGSPAMNFIPGQISFAGDRAALSIATGAILPLPGFAPCRGVEGGQLVHLGVRPENVYLVEPGSEGSVIGHARLGEITGPDTYVAIAVPGHEMMARVQSGRCPRTGERVSVMLDGSAVSLFCPSNGTRLN
jgi:multiple sugar transport system ATP-binding protein